MGFRFSRRRMMQSVGGAALAQSLATVDAAPAPRKWPIEEGPDTPKICLAPGDGGGPLPANMQPAAAGCSAAPGAAGAEEEAAAVAATADFWRPNRTLRDGSARGRCGRAAAAASAIPPPAISASANSA